MAISRRALNRIAFGVGVVGLGSCVAKVIHNDYKFRKFLKEHFESRQYYTEAFRILEGYPNLSRFLEKPITKKEIMVRDKFNKEVKGFATLGIPVEDKNGNTALLMSWSSQHPVEGKDEEHYWRIDRLDLRQDYRVMIYLHPDILNGGHPEAIPVQQTNSNNTTDETSNTVSDNKSSDGRTDKKKG